MRIPLVVGAIAFVIPFTSACRLLDFDDDASTGGGGGGSGSPSGSATASPSVNEVPPSEFQCAVASRAKLVAETRPQHAALTIEAGTAPVITSMEPAAPIWGSVGAIQGTALGNGEGGEYVTFGSGESERHLDACTSAASTFPEYAYRDGTCASFSSYGSRVSFVVPLGATGDIVLHTKRGDAKAGSVGTTWRSSAVHDVAGHHARVLASIATSTATYALVVDEPQSGATSGVAPTLLRFTDTAVSSLKLDALGTVSWGSRAAFAERADGGVDLGVAVTAGGAHSARARFVHVMPDGVDVEIEDACVPSSLGPLVMRRGAAGTIAWVYLETTDTGLSAGLARLVYAADRRVWKIDRGPMDGPRMGEGIERDDGSVLIAWGEPMGVFLDAKAQARFARFSPGDSSFQENNLHEILDDYVHVNVLATSAGFVVGHCSSDSTGFFDDTGTHGSHCHAVQIDGSGAHGTLPGYPETLEPSSTLGVVGDRVVSLRSNGTLGYYESPNDAPSVIAGAVMDAQFVASSPTGSSDKPIVMIAGSGALVVAQR